MATLYSNIAVIENTTPLVRRFSAGERFPQVFFATATYTWTGAEAAADIIQLVKLPQGSCVHPYLSMLTTVGAPAATLTIDVGDDIPTLDPDAYADGLNCAAAGNDLFTAATQPVAQETARILSRDAFIQATIATIGTPAATAGIKLVFTIAYTTLHTPPES